MPPHISGGPSPDLQMIVTIPCYKEPGVLGTINSLHRCTSLPEEVEVIVLVNTPEQAPEKVVQQNRNTYQKLLDWKERTCRKVFELHPVLVENLPGKDAGAGLARKIAMDEAVHRFHRLNRPEGVIISLDADCRVDHNYLTEIRRIYGYDPEMNGSTLYFEHPLEGLTYKKDIYRAITAYELHMRYFRQALRFTGFPYAFHTIGSAFIVRARTYVAGGGMSKRQGGEDFYFLHKVLPVGGFRDITTTTVYPSPRPSDRVPFGTGPVVERYLKNKKLWTYSFDAFKSLKVLFKEVELQYTAGEAELKEWRKAQAEGIRDSFPENEWLERIIEIQQNTGDKYSFRKRFFQWFSAFRIIKYLNATHQSLYRKTEIREAASEMLKEIEPDRNEDMNERELLLHYREIERVQRTYC